LPSYARVLRTGYCCKAGHGRASGAASGADHRATYHATALVACCSRQSRVGKSPRGIARWLFSAFRAYAIGGPSRVRAEDGLRQQLGDVHAFQALVFVALDGGDAVFEHLDAEGAVHGDDL
jgi:hypothetical protein